MSAFLCFDIGGTAVKYGIYQEGTGFVTTGEFPTKAQRGGPSILKRAVETGQKILRQFPETEGICVSTAGMVNPHTGAIVHAAPLIPHYIGLNLKAAFTEALHLPCEVENDVNCAGLAEFFSGAAASYDSCLCLTVGTGIGGCYIEEGRLLRGASFAGCEVGYLKLPGGDFQDLASASALVRRVAAKKGLPEEALSGKEIFSLAAGGDADCAKAIDFMTDCLGLGIANLCYTLNPQVVVLGGGIMSQKEMLYDKIEAACRRYLIPYLAKHTRLAFAENQNRAGMLGAYYHYRSRRS